MNTNLQKVRPNELIVEYTEPIYSKDELGNFVSFFELSRTENKIVVVTNYSDKMMDTILKLIKKDSAYLFFKDELNINPVENCMVPKHESVTDDIPYDINRLPILKILDPIRRWQNFKPGSIVKITRSPTNIYYRKVENE